ncbi:MAG: TRAP transporter small permease [Burkholderiales bacterium]
MKRNESPPAGPVHFDDAVAPGPSVIESASEAICALLMIAAVVLIGAEAIARNFLATSLQITDEIGGYILVAVTFLSMSVAEAHGTFHRVELIQANLKFSTRMIAQIVFDLISLVAAGLVTWQLSRLVLNSWHTEDVAPTPLQTPLWLPQSAMAIGMALLCYALIRTILVKVKRVRRSAGS